MLEKQKDLKEINYKGKYELNLPEFYKALNNAINTNNTESLYELSKIFTRYCFKELDS